MGASLNGGGKRGRGSGRARRAPMSEINVTPFVDVMLVLLIIFMVTAPLLAVGVKVDLPETGAPPLKSSEEPLTITVTQAGQIFLQELEVQPPELLPKLNAIAENGYEERIYIRGDRDVDYGTVMQVMGALNGAGYKRIGLVTDPDQ
ncbi:MAG: protein TolR [Pseudomonadota bacterium]